MLVTKQEGEREGECIHFSWGRKTGVQHYESFTYNGAEYFLYDCVYVWCNDEPEPQIGKLVKIFETHTGIRKAKVVWFFRPIDIQNWLGDVRPLPSELFLASGEGKGIFNVIPLEAICGKCSVVCTSKDRRNTQPTEEELRKASYVYFRTFDAQSRRLSKIFPDLIANVEVKNYFNQRKESQSHPAQEPLSLIKTSEKKAYYPVKNDAVVVPGTSQLLKRKHENPEPSPPRKKHGSAIDVPYSSLPKKIKHGNHSGLSLQSNVSRRKGSEEKAVQLEYKVSEFHAKAEYLEKNKSLRTDSQIMEVARKPTEESSRWFTEQPWEERMLMAQEKGTLVLLGNLDPSFTSIDVESILSCAFNMKVSAKMIQHSRTFSSLHSGQAFVIFKSREAANTVISNLRTRCLMLGDGRPLIARTKALKDPRNQSLFFGHLTIERMKPPKQRIEMRSAVSTSHYSQDNTIEYEMALEWFVLQERSNRWWEALSESQAKDLAELKSKAKIQQ
ncbi:unnamed protein product [Cuscuta campestris]|uniref:BAH domain-containing protein n=1 Tax=Cuscuta campestris TaxID=132261 RepID=A0A484KUK1_9ASTE|nr:unnamed protein product [Cuscuta campestris]